MLGSPHGLGPLHSSGRYPLLLGHAPPSWALVGFVFIFYIIMICSRRELLIHTEAKARWGFVLPGGQGVLCWAEGSGVGAGLLLSWTLAQATAPTKVQEEQAPKGLGHRVGSSVHCQVLARAGPRLVCGEDSFAVNTASSRGLHVPLGLP